MNDHRSRHRERRAIVGSLLLLALALWANQAIAAPFATGDVDDNTAAVRGSPADTVSGGTKQVAPPKKSKKPVATADSPAWGPGLLNNVAAVANPFLGKDNPVSAADVADLKLRLAAAAVAVGNAIAAQSAAEQTAKERLAELKPLREELAKIRAENTRLGDLLGDAIVQRDASDKALAEKEAARSSTDHKFRRANADANALRQAFKTKANELAAANLRIEDLERSLRAIDARPPEAAHARWLWSVAAAAIGAVSALTVSRWMRSRHTPPKTADVAGVSVTIADWSLGIRGDQTVSTPPFQVHTQWLPVDMQVRPFGAFLRPQSEPSNQQEMAA